MAVESLDIYLLKRFIQRRSCSAGNVHQPCKLQVCNRCAELSPSVDLWMSSVSALHGVMDVCCFGSCSFHSELSMNRVAPQSHPRSWSAHRCTCTSKTDKRRSKNFMPDLSSQLQNLCLYTYHLTKLIHRTSSRLSEESSDPLTTSAPHMVDFRQVQTVSRSSSLVVWSFEPCSSCLGAKRSLRQALFRGKGGPRHRTRTPCNPPRRTLLTVSSRACSRKMPLHLWIARRSRHLIRPPTVRASAKEKV